MGFVYTKTSSVDVRPPPNVTKLRIPDSFAAQYKVQDANEATSEMLEEIEIRQISDVSFLEYSTTMLWRLCAVTVMYNILTDTPPKLVPVKASTDAVGQNSNYSNSHSADRAHKLSEDHS